MDVAVTILVAIIGSGIFNTILTYFIHKSEKKQDLHDGITEAARLIMKDRLRFLCVHYIQQGWIYEDELDDLIKMHECYHDDLNGNGFLDKLMERVNKLDIRGIGVK